MKPDKPALRTEQTPAALRGRICVVPQTELRDRGVRAGWNNRFFAKRTPMGGHCLRPPCDQTESASGHAPSLPCPRLSTGDSGWISYLVVPGTPDRLRSFRQTLLLALCILVLAGTPDQVLAASFEPMRSKPAAASDVAEILRNHMALQIKELEGRIKELENRSYDSNTLDPKVVADMLRKELAAQKRELDGRIKSLEDKPPGGAAPDPTGVADILRKEMAAQKKELEGKLQKQVDFDAAIDLKTLPRKIKDAKAAGDIACLGLVLLVVGFTVSWFLGLRHVLRRVREHLSPNNPENVRGKVKKEFDLTLSGTIANRVAALEARAQKQASVAAPSPNIEALKQRIAALEAAAKAGGVPASSARTTGQPARPNPSASESKPVSSRLALTPAALAPLAQEPPSPPLFDADWRERIGRCYVEFCRSNPSVFDLDEFALVLAQALPEAGVQVAYRIYSSPAANFYAEPPQSAYSRAWVVSAGAGLYLLPWAITADEFDTVRECFVVAPGTIPQNLADCLPAILEVEGNRWVVTGEHQGRLSQQPVEKPRLRRNTPTADDSAQLASVKASSPSAPVVPAPPSVVTSPSPAPVVPFSSDIEKLKKQVASLLGEVVAVKSAAPSEPGSGTADQAKRAELKSVARANALGADASEPGMREKIGLCFVEFCRRDHTVYALEEFEIELRKMVPEARVQVVYRKTSSQEVFFHRERPGTAFSKGWVVILGEQLFLLPSPLSATDFDTVIDCFKISLGTMPKNLRDCLPALLLAVGKSWGVVEAGRLSAQPDEKLQRWWEASQKPGPFKSLSVASMSLAPTPGSGAQTLDMPTAATVGQEFVRFCQQALRDNAAVPKFEDFLAILHQRFPGASLTGRDTTVSSDSTRVWQVLAGSEGQATKGWILPAIQSVKDFHLFGDVFVPEGAPTPGTVEQVVPADIWRLPGGGNNKWNIKPGKVMARRSGGLPTLPVAAVPQGQAAGNTKTTRTRTPWEEEIMTMVGAAFVKACGKIARREFPALQTQHDLQEALVHSGLAACKPSFEALDIVLSLQSVPRLRKAGPNGVGDVWLLQFVKGQEQVLLVTPRLTREFVRFGAQMATLFPLSVARSVVTERIEVASVTTLVPCQVRSVSEHGEYEVVSKGGISKI